MRSNFDEVAIGKLVEAAKKWNPLQEAPTSVISYVDISSVDKDEKKITSVTEVIGSEAPSRARQLIRKGDVLVSTVRPNLNGVAYVPAEIDGATASTGYCVLRPKNGKLDSRYLFHWVRTPFFVDSMTLQAIGASYPAVTDKIVKQSQIPLPLLSEQRRIAAILDKADALRQQRRATLNKLDDLLQSIFLDMFGDPVTNPKGWEVKELGEIIKFVGGSQPAKKHFRGQHEAGMVRLVQIRDFKTDEYITYVPRDMCRRFFEEDDIMIARYGPPVFQILRGLSGAYNVALMKAEPRKGVLKDFVFYLLQTPKLHRYVVAHSERTAGQSGVNLKLLNPFPAYLPPKEIQVRFSNILSAAEEVKGKHQQELEKLDSLFQSLQQRAFSGEL